MTPQRPTDRKLWPFVVDVGDEEDAVWLLWLIRLRWLAIAAQLVTLALTFRVLYSPLLVLPLGAVVLALALGNLRALHMLRGRTRVGSAVLSSQLAIDIVALTSFFLLGGGPDNPFTILYIIHVAMASVMLSVRRAAWITLGVIACYGLLFTVHLPLSLENHVLPRPTLDFLGRATSFAIASASVYVFVAGLARTLRSRSRELLEARDRTARTDRLRSVGTLAAGAAHELNTPLGTIGLRIRRMARRHDDADTQKDVEVISAQLERCKAVVEQLLFGAGDPSAAGLERRNLERLVHEAVALWRRGSEIDVAIVDASDEAVVEVPRVAFGQALTNLLENAREAQREVGCVEPLRITLHREDGTAVVALRDRGCGLPGSMERVGEPFFTTKSTGTGLGVYVARSVAEGAGGGIRYSALPEGGTEVRWWFPEANRRTA